MNVSEIRLIRRLALPDLSFPQTAVLRALCVLHRRGKLPLPIRLGWHDISRFERLCDAARLTESDGLSVLAQLARKQYVRLEQSTEGRYACWLNLENAALQAWIRLGFCPEQRGTAIPNPLHHRRVP